MQSNIPKLTELMPLLNPIYPEQYHELFMQIKLKIQAKQYTRQLNDMIEKLIVFGESNYTCWIAKKRIIESGQISIEQQDQYCRELLADNLKNFQIWDYRNYIFQATKDYKTEYALMDKILEISPKNYHLWSNRIRVVDYAKNYQQEIDTTLKYIYRDVFNNSVWAYRHYCYWKINASKSDHHQEIQWVITQIRKNILNEAAWNYLRGFFPSIKIQLYNNHTKSSNKLLQYTDYPEVEQLCKQIVSDSEQNQQSKVHVFITLLTINSQSSQRKQFAKQNCNYLMELEPLRKTYYQWLESVL